MKPRVITTFIQTKYIVYNKKEGIVLFYWHSNWFLYFFKLRLDFKFFINHVEVFIFLFIWYFELETHYVIYCPQTIKVFTTLDVLSNNYSGSGLSDFVLRLHRNILSLHQIFPVYRVPKLYENWNKHLYVLGLSQRRFLLFKSEIATIAHFLPVNYPAVTTFGTYLFIVDGWIKWFSFLNALSTNWSIKVKAGQKSRSALETSKAVHLSFWFPAFKNVHSDCHHPTLVILEPQFGQEVSLCSIPQLMQ